MKNKIAVYEGEGSPFGRYHRRRKRHRRHRGHGRGSLLAKAARHCKGKHGFRTCVRKYIRRHK